MSTIKPVLKHGSHLSPEQGMCAMEWASYLAGEPHSDHPRCVSPVVRRYMIRLNDRLDDATRQRLAPYVLRSLGTADDGQNDERAQMCTEFVLRDSLPFWLDAAGMTAEAERVRAMTSLDYGALAEIRRAAWAKRDANRAALKARVRAEMVKRGKPAADAVAAADAAAAAVADADAAAAAVAAADAAAAAAAVADAVAAAAAVAGDPWGEVYTAAYKAARASYDRWFAEHFPDRADAAFDLLDRMLPETPLMAPVPGRAGVVAGWSA